MSKFFVQDGDTFAFTNNDRDFAAGYVKQTRQVKELVVTLFKTIIWKVTSSSDVVSDLQIFTDEFIAQSYILNNYIANDLFEHVNKAYPGLGNDGLKQVLESINDVTSNDASLTFAKSLADSLFEDEPDAATDTQTTEA